jgi:hypothetical protein
MKIRVAPWMLSALAITVQAAAPLQLARLPLEAHIQKFTGLEAVDCGTHSLFRAQRERLRDSLTCARGAAAKRAAFDVIQRGFGTDSEIAFGVLGKSDGSVWWFDYDSAPCGGPGCAERFTVTPCSFSEAHVMEDPGPRYRLSCKR